MMATSLSRSVVALPLIVLMANANAATISIDATESGWITSDGLPTNNEDSENYVVGVVSFGGTSTEHRNWFLFDLSGVDETVTSASLNIYNPTSDVDIVDGFNSIDRTETYSLFSYESSITDLSDELGLGSYDDLGDGTLFGSVTVSDADNGTVISIALNGDAIDAINSATGPFVFGGALTSLSGQTDFSELLFGGTFPEFTRELVLTTVPVPAAIWLFASACGLMGTLKLRRPTAL